MNRMGKMFLTYITVPTLPCFLLFSKLVQALWMYYFYKLKINVHIHKHIRLSKKRGVTLLNWNLFIIPALSTLFFELSLLSLRLIKELTDSTRKAGLISVKHCIALKSAEQVKNKSKGIKVVLTMLRTWANQ